MLLFVYLTQSILSSVILAIPAPRQQDTVADLNSDYLSPSPSNYYLSPSPSNSSTSSLTNTTNASSPVPVARNLSSSNSTSSGRWNWRKWLFWRSRKASTNSNTPVNGTLRTSEKNKSLSASHETTGYQSTVQPVAPWIAPVIGVGLTSTSPARISPASGFVAGAAGAVALVETYDVLKASRQHKIQAPPALDTKHWDRVNAAASGFAVPSSGPQQSQDHQEQQPLPRFELGRGRSSPASLSDSGGFVSLKQWDDQTQVPNVKRMKLVPES